jgi:uncharacterized protein
VSGSDSRERSFSRSPTPADVLHLNPTPPSEREPILDALRGFAVLGILLVNIQVMKGPDWFVRVGGGSVPSPGDITDRLVQFAIGWLGTGKFVSSLSILFGIGAALIAARSLRAGQSPRLLLARRYVWLMVFGIAHMLLFPGDILFVYGVTGIALLAFVRLRARAVLFCAVAIMLVLSALGVAYMTAQPDADTYINESPPAHSGNILLDEKRAETIAAFTTGSFRDIAAVHAWQALLLQRLQLTAVPLLLALFLLGYAVGRAGVLDDLGAHRKLLRRGAWIGIGWGLPANIGLGFGGPLAGWGPPPQDEPLWVTHWITLGDFVGEPVLAVGYLCALTLFCLQRGAIQPLAAVGRMALSAYLLQSAIALAVFGGMRLYGELSPAPAALVVVAIWAVLLVICPLWLRWFQLGPAEWLWRSLSYRNAQPMRRRSDGASLV